MRKILSNVKLIGIPPHFNPAMTRRTMLLRARYPTIFVYEFPEKVAGRRTDERLIILTKPRDKPTKMTHESSDDPYTSEYPPGCSIDSEIKAFIRHYYTQVDIQGKHAEYSQCWSENGSLVVPQGKEFRGRDAIRELHQGMWDGVPKRIHRPLKVFPFGENANEVVIVGSVEYWMDNGSYVKKDMAAHAKYNRNPKTSDIEMSSLQVWLTG